MANGKLEELLVENSKTVVSFRISCLYCLHFLHQVYQIAKFHMQATFLKQVTFLEYCSEVFYILQNIFHLDFLRPISFLEFKKQDAKLLNVPFIFARPHADLVPLLRKYESGIKANMENAKILGVHN